MMGVNDSRCLASEAKVSGRFDPAEEYPNMGQVRVNVNEATNKT